MAVKYINPELCDGCNICVEDCPVEVFVLNPATGKAVAAYNRDCWECFLCQDICPKKAIEVSPASERTLRRAF